MIVAHMLGIKCPASFLIISLIVHHILRLTEVMMTVMIGQMQHMNVTSLLN